VIAENTLEGSARDYKDVAIYLYCEIKDVHRFCTCLGVFYIFLKFFKKSTFHERSDNFHSCYGVKGRYFTLFRWVRKEVNSYGAIFFRKADKNKKAV